MKTAEFDINTAEGVRLFADYHLDDKFYPQGHALTKEDIIIFKMFGIRQVFGAIMDDDDLDIRTALGIVAAKVCGTNTAYTIGEDNVCRIIADADGVFISTEERLAKFNRLHPEIVLNAVAPYHPAAKGEIIARLEMTMPIIPQAELDEILFKLSGNVALLQVAPKQNFKTAFIYTKLLEDRAETAHFTEVVKTLVKNFAPYNLDFAGEYNAAYSQNAIADALQDAVKDGYEAIFVLGATRSACRDDVLPGALRKIVDTIACSHLPQVGASDLLLAQKRNAKIIVLPYNYNSTDTTTANRYIKQALFCERLTAADFAKMIPETLPDGEIISSETTLIAAKNNNASGKKANIAAIVLAAGIGSRAGRNKLMVEVAENVPLFMNAVNAAIASEARPVFVITGYHDEDMAEYLDKVDVNVIYNPAYRSGIKTSIDLGMKSVPGFCDGAMIIPADMPNLTAADLNKLIASFKPNQEKQVSVFACKGVKSNPIIWSKALYDKADIVPENAAIRPVFMEHADYTNVVDVKSADKLLDVNYPSDIEKAAWKKPEPAAK